MIFRDDDKRQSTTKHTMKQENAIKLWVLSSSSWRHFGLDKKIRKHCISLTLQLIRLQVTVFFFVDSFVCAQKCKTIESNITFSGCARVSNPSFVVGRSSGEWMHKCCHHNDWEAIWFAIIANRTRCQRLWHCLVCVLGAGNLFRWTCNSIEAALDWHRNCIDGTWFITIFIATLYRWLLSRDERRCQHLYTGQFNVDDGKFASIERKTVFFSSICTFLFNYPFPSILKRLDIKWKRWKWKGNEKFHQKNIILNSIPVRNAIFYEEKASLMMKNGNKKMKNVR